MKKLNKLQKLQKFLNNIYWQICSQVYKFYFIERFRDYIFKLKQNILF